MSRTSNVLVEISGQEESRTTAKFTNQSLTYLEDHDVDEFSKDHEDDVGNTIDQQENIERQEGLITINEGRRRIQEEEERI